MMGSGKTNRLITEIDIGPTHDTFAVWLYTLDRGRGTGKDADKLSVVGHCWCTKNYQNDALEHIQKKIFFCRLLASYLGIYTVLWLAFHF